MKTCECIFDDEVCAICGAMALSEVEKLKAEVAVARAELAETRALLLKITGSSSASTRCVRPTGETL